jgi:hypothetical protein
MGQKLLTKLWSVERLRGSRAKHLGIVKAKTRRGALKIASARFSIQPQQRGVIALTQLDDD